MGRIAKLKGATELAKIVEAGRHAAGNHLYLEVGAKGSRAWVLRYVWVGQPTWAGLGSVDMVHLAASLEDARTRAQEMLDAIERGEDPLGYKRPAGKLDGPRIWVAQALEDYLPIARRQWGNPDYAKSMEKRLRKYLHPILNRPVGAIRDTDVANVFRPYWTEQPTTALVTRMHVQRMLAMALGAKAANPATLESVTAKLGPTYIEAKHHPALGYRELPAIMTELEAIDTPASLALQFAILTGSRTQEARDAVWSEFDLDAKLWTLPRVGGRVKHRPRRANGKVIQVAPHVVPLSTYALAILERCPRGEPTGRVFGYMGDNALYRLLTRKLKLAGKASVHGARTAFGTWCGDNGIPKDVSDKALSHVDNDPYHKSPLMDMRVNALQRWGFYLTTNG